ncbi:hypothetical protein BC936DRAFT_144568 [Jimgerdemannia flammicorona]|uniref:Uncharacterized protein n=1 Tax=Jimgerdemannia flammicorona TaxID=994334 RepID=A0A433DM19_9FUNG|nr:hypothetical protein BC936DRAFT_144568 [Jimgerdemannia flammicorona]
MPLRACSFSIAYAANLPIGAVHMLTPEDLLLRPDLVITEYLCNDLISGFFEVSLALFTLPYIWCVQNRFQTVRGLQKPDGVAYAMYLFTFMLRHSAGQGFTSQAQRNRAPMCDYSRHIRVSRVRFRRKRLNPRVDGEDECGNSCQPVLCFNYFPLLQRNASVDADREKHIRHLGQQVRRSSASQ